MTDAEKIIKIETGEMCQYIVSKLRPKVDVLLYFYIYNWHVSASYYAESKLNHTAFESWSFEENGYHRLNSADQYLFAQAVFRQLDLSDSKYEPNNYNREYFGYRLKRKYRDDLFKFKPIY